MKLGAAHQLGKALADAVWPELSRHEMSRLQWGSRRQGLVLVMPISSVNAAACVEAQVFHVEGDASTFSTIHFTHDAVHTCASTQRVPAYSWDL